MINYLSLFSGIGAFEKAMKNLGIEYNLVGFSEIDKFATKSYCAVHNVDESKNLGDITKVDETKLPNVDLITYGFPCQDISVAGKQQGLFNDDGTQTRSGLFFEALRIIEGTKPKFCIAENVKNLTSKKFAKEFEIVLDSLEKAGYNNYWQVLNAKDYGIPQNRERVFIVSISKDIDKCFRFPQPFLLELKLKDMLEDKVEDKYYLSNTGIKYFENQANKRGESLEQYKERKIITLAHGRCKGNIKDDKIRPTLDTQFSNNWHGVLFEPKQATEKIVCEQRTDEGLRFFKNNVCGTLRTINACGDKRVLEVERTPLKFLNRNQKNTDGDYAFCVDTANTGGVKEHYDDATFRIRKLTPLECWRLMGFEDEDFYKAKEVPTSDSQLYKQAGNSIVVNVAEEILKELFPVKESKNESSK